MKTFKEFFLEHCGCPYADAEAAEEEKKQELKKKRRRKVKDRDEPIKEESDRLSP